jgi:hypothetical protein
MEFVWRSPKSLQKIIISYQEKTFLIVNNIEEEISLKFNIKNIN